MLPFHKRRLHRSNGMPLPTILRQTIVQRWHSPRIGRSRTQYSGMQRNSSVQWKSLRDFYQYKATDSHALPMALRLGLCRNRFRGSDRPFEFSSIESYLRLAAQDNRDELLDSLGLCCHTTFQMSQMPDS